MSVDLLNDLDGWAHARNKLRELAEMRGDWAGYPMLLEDFKLVIEPRYPYADVISEFGRKKIEDEPGIKLRNTFYSRQKRCDIYVYEENGKVKHAWAPAVHRFSHDLMAVGASVAWGLEQEGKAVQTLGTLLRHHTFKQYLLTGSFLESSKRSGLTYMFRKLRPTVAMHGGTDDTMQILCALCMHPIGYYDGTSAGVMCPTDDVIAHLMMMRADEHMFWKRCNQHAPHRPEAGLG